MPPIAGRLTQEQSCLNRTAVSQAGISRLGSHIVSHDHSTQWAAMAACCGCGCGCWCCTAGLEPMAVPTTMPMPLVRPSLHGRADSFENNSGTGGAIGLQQWCCTPLAQTQATAVCSPWQACAPEHEAGAGGEILGALQEAEAHACAVARAANGRGSKTRQRVPGSTGMCTVGRWLSIAQNDGTKRPPGWAQHAAD